MFGKFLYFAYGSNLLCERLQMQNKSAIFKQIAKLEDFKLVFSYWSKRWHGHAASIDESLGNTVWGVLYELNNSDLENLDKQEDVKSGIYRPLSVQVKDTLNNLHDCRTYQLVRNDFGMPSPQYKDIIVRGAEQHHLPSEYIEMLTAICDNGCTEDVPLYNELLEIIRGEHSSKNLKFS